MKFNPAVAIIVLLVVIAVVVGVQTYINTVDASTIPGGVYVKAFFSTASVTVAVTFLVNIGGYIENAVASKSNIQYEASQLGATFARYTVYMTAFSSMITAVTIGTPAAAYAAEIAAGLSLIIDLVKRSLAKLAPAALPIAQQTQNASQTQT